MYRHRRQKVHRRRGSGLLPFVKWPAIRAYWPCTGGPWPVRRAPGSL